MYVKTRNRWMFFFLTLHFTKILYNLHQIAIFGWSFMSVGMKRENMFDTLVLLVMEESNGYIICIQF